MGKEISLELSKVLEVFDAAKAAAKELRIQKLMEARDLEAIQLKKAEEERIGNLEIERVRKLGKEVFDKGTKIVTSYAPPEFINNGKVFSPYAPAEIKGKEVGFAVVAEATPLKRHKKGLLPVSHLLSLKFTKVNICRVNKTGKGGYEFYPEEDVLFTMKSNGDLETPYEDKENDSKDFKIKAASSLLDLIDQSLEGNHIPRVFRQDQPKPGEFGLIASIFKPLGLIKGKK